MDPHPSLTGLGWEFINGKCRPVHYTRSPLPHQLRIRLQGYVYDSRNGSICDDESEVYDSTDSAACRRRPSRISRSKLSQIVKLI